MNNDELVAIRERAEAADRYNPDHLDVLALLDEVERLEAALARVREAITSHQFGEQDADDTLAAITDATIHGGEDE